MSTVNQNIHEVKVHKLLIHRFYTPEFIVNTARYLGFNPDDDAAVKIAELQRDYFSDQFIEKYDNVCDFLDIVDFTYNGFPVLKNENAQIVSKMLMSLND